MTVLLKHFSVEEHLKQLFISLGTPVYKNKKKKNYKETFVSAWRFLQYFQLPARNSRDISRFIYNFCGISQQLRISFTKVTPTNALIQADHLKHVGESKKPMKFVYTCISAFLVLLL
jgi:hypothetical protein